MKRFAKYLWMCLLLPTSLSCAEQGFKKDDSGSYPRLVLTRADVPGLIDGISKYPLLKTSFQESVNIAKRAIETGIEVPIPTDPGGGYTHEKHKQNAIDMYHAGSAYQLTGKENYAVFVRDMLISYQDLYPKLGLHPMIRNQSPGKLFWQGLNESVWLVYAIQAYDCIYTFLGEEERELIETNLFRKMVHFFTEEDPYSFNRVHNHGTWAVAGVGMTGMILNDTLMVQKALYSTKLDGSGGFLKQIDELFSPDGYYAEGPYYQRYALMPFVLFAQALENNLPELNIFEYKNGVLGKAVNTLLQLTNTDGHYYPINDAIKDKTWVSPELIFATNIMFAQTGNSELLDVAGLQGRVMLSSAGLETAKMLESTKILPFKHKSALIHDGPDGSKGGLALLRIGEGKTQSSVLFKFSSQGMGHGHFDRLGILLYDKGNEIISDYGSVRFLNVVAKEGGIYLKENNSWAKQTIAHNTLVINQQSHFNGKLAAAEAHSPQILFSDLENEQLKIVSARDSSCYEATVLKRTLAFFEHNNRRFLIDLFDIARQKPFDYDYPLNFNGQIIEMNFPYTRSTEYVIAGKENGYQHLKVEARASELPSTTSFTWMNGKGFYTLASLVRPGSEFIVTRVGANDPDFNLRNQSGLLIRQSASGSTKVLNVFEIHGEYNPASEQVMNSESSVKDLELAWNSDDLVVVKIIFKNSREIILLVDNRFRNNSSNKIADYTWQGNYKLIQN